MKIKHNLRTLAISLLVASLLAACGGGATPATNNTANNNPNAVTPVTPAPVVINPVTGAPVGTPPAAAPIASTPAALTAIQAQLTIWQNKFATTRPLATDPALVALFDASFLSYGNNASSFLAIQASGIGAPPVGFIFAPVIGVNSLDVGAVPNDATHQWFATQINAGAGFGAVQYFRWLAIKNAAGQWLLAGNQRRVSVNVGSVAYISFAAATVGIPAPAPSIFSQMYFSLGTTNALGVSNVNGATSATVSGPGVIGATAGVLGAASLYSAGVQVSVPLCGVLPAFAAPGAVAATTNCIDLAKAVNGGTYSFNVIGTDPVTAAAFNVTYNDLFTAVPPAALTAANFPAINSTNPATLAGFVPNTAVTVNWTAPVGQTPAAIRVYGNTVGNYAVVPPVMPVILFSKNLTVAGGAGAAVVSTGALPATFSAGVVATVLIQAHSVDMNGLYYTTTMSY
jgi:hypothetical protein